MTKFDPNEYLEVFLLGNVLKIINFMGKSLEFFINKNWQWYPHFLIKICQEILVFMIEKWTELFYSFLVQVHSKTELSSVQVPSAKKWTEFSSKFTKKVNFWTELNFSVQFSHFLDYWNTETMPFITNKASKYYNSKPAFTINLVSKCSLYFAKANSLRFSNNHLIRYQYLGISI